MPFSAPTSRMTESNSPTAFTSSGPRLWEAYREAMADGEQQEFVSRRPHHVIRDDRLEYMARKRISRSRVPLTLRDAILLAFDAEVRMERRSERERDRRLAKKRQANGRQKRRS
jgi:hypothetical protein